MKTLYLRISLLVLLTASSLFASAVTYRTIRNGDWTVASTWLGGNIPNTAGTIPVADTIFILHRINYNTGNNLTNSGVFWIRSLGSDSAILTLPTNINVENQSAGRFFIDKGAFYQCRFEGCGNSGLSQSGTFKNIGGLIRLNNAFVEVAQDWTSESGGKRIFNGGCLYTGQNFSLSTTGSIDTLINVTISIGWHGSGNFQLSDGFIYFDSTSIQLAGTSGSFELNSGNARGTIPIISMYNQVSNSYGSGSIILSSSLTTGTLFLNRYCLGAGAYIPNGKITGTPLTTNCNAGTNGYYFPGKCLGGPLTFVPVDWIYFKATPIDETKKVILNWGTAMEINNRHFEVLRSENLKDFEVIGERAGKGTYNGVSQYQFTDQILEVNKTYYYYIRQVDYDGKSSITDVVSVDFRNLVTGYYNIFPNPLGDKLFVIAEGKLIEKIEILNLAGVIIQTTSPEKTVSTCTMDTEDWAPGIYFIRIYSGSTVTTQKLLK